MKRVRQYEQQQPEQQAPRASCRLVEARCRLEEQLQAMARKRYDLSFTCYGAVDHESLRSALEQALRHLSGHSEPAGSFQKDFQLHPEDRSLLDVHARCVVTGQHDVCVVRVLDEAGAVHWVSSVLQPVMDERGRQVVQVTGWLQDLSGRSMPRPQLQGSHAPLDWVRAHA